MIVRQEKTTDPQTFPEGTIRLTFSSDFDEEGNAEVSLGNGLE